MKNIQHNKSKIPNNYFKRRIAMFSDTHCGSSFAVFPEGVESNFGNTIGINKGQKKLLKYFNSFVQAVLEWDCDTVICLGDSIEGGNKKEFGKYLVTPELENQKKGFIELIKPMIKGRNFLMTSGSGYHGSLDTDVHGQMIKECRDIANIKYLGGVANLNLTGTNRMLHVEHGESAAMIYRSTLLDREGLFHLQSEAQGKIPKADIIAFGHGHSYLKVELRKQLLMQLPCWKAFEPSKIFLKSYGKMQPDIGAVILLIDNNDNIFIQHYDYPLPHIADMVQEC